ncbi:MAG TPA: hotdog fold domain-containing protein [Longimicrobium sp.]|jgi:acyl-coenzyme A thioesterase PaaI-like protein|uniref:hotdog fold domain-containing protein n=1 Tax=Longimicrobium sp. TaxID=2029185 RepID=UPI002ED88A0E
MANTATTPEAAIRQNWERLSGRPGGKAMFSWMLGRLVPYSGSIGARVEEMRPGYARVTLRDRRRVRNHLRSVHAIAMMNLAELATGLALNYGMRPDTRSILKGLSIEYTKKARGTLTAEATAPVLESNEEREIEVTTSIRDTAGDVVATAVAKWLVGPRK